MTNGAPTNLGVKPLRHYILGMRMDYLDWDEGVERVISAAGRGVSDYCCVPDVNECVICHDEPDHRDIVNNSLLVLSDSTILQRTRALLVSEKPVKTVKGAEIMLELCRRAADEGIPIALIGGKNEIVLSRLTEKLLELLPSLKIVFVYSPPFTPTAITEDTALGSAINACGARLIFVGLGCPKQERWMARHKGQVSGIMIGVGAAFDFISGAVQKSPPWVHRMGLEWLYRLLREPRRLWRRYLLVAPRFLWLVLVAELRRCLRSRV